jgi:antirestriction protein ArdC
LRNDSRFIFKATAHAQRAADYLASFSRGDDGTAATDVNDEAEARAA